MKKARLLLEDGSVILGRSFGAETTVCGELVFNTGMTGYQEILTDPSYGGQIVTMTYPLVGNYGINPVDVESERIQVTAFVVKEFAAVPSHWQSEKSLNDYLKENNIPGICGVDTRMLTKKIRNGGAMKCLLTTDEITQVHEQMLKDFIFPADIVAQVSCKTSTHFEGTGKKVAVLDLGLKKGIVKQFKNLGCDVTVYPHDTDAKIIEAGQPDVVFFSNGPGDPKDAKNAILVAQYFMGKLPLWGICLGHQILALALGADTYKLKFGHRGANHPVIELETNKVYMSAQNHGYAVKEEGLPDEIRITHMNVNDNTVEGISCEMKDVVSVQFHPEEGPGPEDAHYLFKKWLDKLNGKGLVR